MKKLINDVPTSWTSPSTGSPELTPTSSRCRTIPASSRRADGPVSGKVGLVSGGGSGHEPLHAGFVGKGMLDAAVPGEVFTSPTPMPIVEATKAADGGAGVLHIVKNYTGDVLNFETAADLVGAEGITVRSRRHNDDVAVQDSPLHRRSPRCRRNRARREDRGRGGRTRRRPGRGDRGRREGQRQRPLDRSRPRRRHGAARRRSPASTWPTTRSSSASASTASPAASASSWSRPTGWSTA